MTDLRNSLLAQHAQCQAEAAEREVEAKWFCRTCEQHRVRRAGAQCPCCEGAA